jgi:uncharacterized repeat protein (TIGR03803 family)
MLASWPGARFFRRQVCPSWRWLMRCRVLLLALLTSCALLAHAQYKFTILHGFGAGIDGGGVYSSVTLDADGNLYGTTVGGGAYSAGTVFRLRSGTDGRWSESILHHFGSFSSGDGEGPLGGLVFDSTGNLYGTTETAGRYHRGTVFRLTQSGGRWVESTLYDFCKKPQCRDGAAPWGNVALDGLGNVYATAGYAVELSPSTNGWTELVLHRFTGKNGDGSGPQAGPIRDAAGNLYGTTLYGGGSNECGGGCGTVWEMQPAARGGATGAKSWKEHILHRFGYGHDGGFPSLGPLAMDQKGNLYGTTKSGGPRRAGTVYKLTRSTAPSRGSWKETILHGFAEDQDGFLPEGGVILDQAGNIFGTTGAGGGFGYGVVFELSPLKNGHWKYTLLHAFNGSDGSNPTANLTLGPDGKLYGTASVGGPHGGGVVFEITP